MRRMLWRERLSKKPRAAAGCLSPLKRHPPRGAPALDYGCVKRPVLTFSDSNRTYLLLNLSAEDRHECCRDQHCADLVGLVHRRSCQQTLASPAMWWC